MLYFSDLDKQLFTETDELQEVIQLLLVFLNQPTKSLLYDEEFGISWTDIGTRDFRDELKFKLNRYLKKIDTKYIVTNINISESIRDTLNIFVFLNHAQYTYKIWFEKDISDHVKLVRIIQK